MPRRPQVPGDLSPGQRKAAKMAPEPSVAIGTTGTTQGPGELPKAMHSARLSVEDRRPVVRQVEGQPGRSTTLLLREAARSEALKFMPAVSQTLANPAVSINTKLRLFELLLQYGVGNRPQESAKSAISAQVAVVALMPRQDANAVLPIANPVEKLLGAGRGLLGPAGGISSGG